MKSYTRIYLDFFGYSVADFIPCEGCGARSSDIHHLVPRSRAMNLLNEPSNLIALCRPCHIRAESSRDYNDTLKAIHKHNFEKIAV